MAGVSFGEQYGDCAGAVTDCGTPVDHSHVLFALDCTKCQSHNFTVTDRPAIIQAYDLSANALATLHMVTGSSNTERLAPVLGKNGLKGQLSTARNRMVVCVPGVYALKWEDCTSRGYIEVKFATKDYEVECTEGVHAPAQLHSVSREMVVTPTGLDDQTFIVQLDYRRLSQASLDDLALMLDSRDDINVEGILQQRIAAGGLVGSVGHIAPITDTGTVGHPIIGVDLAALDSRTTNILNQSITNGGLVGSVGHTAPITDTGTAGQPVIGIDLVALDSRTTNLLNQTITNGGLIGSVGRTAPITDTGTVGQPVIGLDIPALVSPAAGNALSVGPDGKLFLSATGGSVTGTAPIIVTGSDVSIDLAALDSRTTNLLNQSITNGGLVGSVGHTAPITDTGTPGSPNIGLSIPALVSTDAGNTLAVGTDGKLRVAPSVPFGGSVRLATPGFTIRDLCQFNGLWVAAGVDSAGATVIKTSPDLRTWTTRQTGAPSVADNVAVSAGGGSVVASLGAQVYASTDGISWVAQVTDTTTKLLRSLAFRNGYWSLGVYNHPNALWVSPTGTAWTLLAPGWTMQQSAPTRGIDVFGKTYFDTTGGTRYTVNHATFAAVPFVVRNIIVGPAVAIGTTANGPYYTTDGVTWLSSGLGPVGGGLFSVGANMYAVSANGTVYRSTTGTGYVQVLDLGWTGTAVTAFTGGALITGIDGVTGLNVSVVTRDGVEYSDGTIPYAPAFGRDQFSRWATLEPNYGILRFLS